MGTWPGIVKPFVDVKSRTYIYNSTHDATMDKLVNMRQPVVHQVYQALRYGNIDRDAYYVWTHQPHYFMEAPKHATLFSNPVLEACSKMTWWTVPCFWFPVLAVFLWACNVASMPLSLGCVCAAAGLTLWSLVEYVVHRFLFHAKPLNWWPALMVHFLMHGIHHRLPSDPYRLVLPPFVSVSLAVVVLTPLYVCTSLVLDLPAFSCLASGLVTGYVGYDLYHYALHHGTMFVPVRQRVYHLRHHGANEHSAGFGITTILWDTVLGTRPSSCK